MADETKQHSPDVDGFVAAVEKMIGVEMIDGSDVRDVARDYVMLEVAFTPVLPHRLPVDPATEHLGYVPTPCRVQLDGTWYCVLMPDCPEKYRWASEDELKVMRARYLLLRAWYVETIEGMPHSERQEVLAKFFKDGLFIPDCLRQSQTPVDGA